MSAKFLVEARHLYRRYGPAQAVSDVSLTLRQGEVLGLLGPNGAGKSTTMRMLTGNLAPSAGEILINGIDLLDRPREAKRHLGYLPEQPPVYRDLRVDEYLAYCASLHGLKGGKARTAVADALERCALTDVRRRLIGNLSKGYQQRVGIAQAILHRPAVVILDEPTVGLDPIQIREIRDLIRELGREYSVILSTHILPEVQAVCDRVQMIHRGRTVFDDTLDGLEGRHAEPVLVAGFERPPGEAALRVIPGVEGVERLADGRFRLRHRADARTAGAIAKAAVEGDWGLAELTPERATLEQIFVDLVHREHDTEAAA
ncbi:MAG: ATP-binding cassette domain-containing protein [Chromatiales bacterium]|nr:ATP-binding cassette domain-containing protein [Chromatiales bacterium]